MAKTKKLPKSNSVKKKKTTAGKDSSIKIGTHVWPLQRDVLFRPDRLKYVRKLIKPAGCVFCEAVKNKMSFDSLCMYQSKHSMVLLNKFPYNPGHVLILPKKHIGNILELSEEEWVDLQNTVRKTFSVIEKVFKPGGMNMGLNHGAVAGAGIPEHIHYHLVPRWSGDLNFFPLIAETKAVPMSLEEAYQILQKGFQEDE